MNRPIIFRLLIVLCAFASADAAEIDSKQSDVYKRLKTYIDSVPAIDSHDHLRRFEDIPHRVRTPDGEGLTLYSIWAGSYYVWNHPLTDWPKSGKFTDWWSNAKHDFDDALEELNDFLSQKANRQTLSDIVEQALDER